jgi:uncharacterized protein (DUF2062 family)
LRWRAEAHLQRIAAQVRDTPEALVCAVRSGDSKTPGPGGCLERGLANFWFRVQTGAVCGEATGTLRAYPLALLESLRTVSRGGPGFDYEMLVRSVWAGAELRQVRVTDAGEPVARAPHPLRWILDRFFFALLNIHLTLRSVLPRLPGGLARPAAAESEISLRHPWRSLKFLVGQRIPPARLGWAAALGVFLGALPLVGVHSIAILFAAGFFRLSRVAALGASQLCMPPLVPALCIEAGHYLRHGVFLTEISLRTLGYEALDRLLEWILGSLLMAPFLGALAGGLVFAAARCIARRSSPEQAMPARESTG